MASAEPDASSDHLVQLKGVNGWAFLPVALKSADGSPRFEIKFPANRVDDLGFQCLIRGEVTGGYESATRRVLENVFRAGDLFIDVGAHWGNYTLQAATHPAGDIRIMAIEPDPENAAILYAGLLHNKVAHKVQLICLACGDASDLAPLVTNSSMAHSIRGTILGEVTSLPPKFVVVATLDSVLACFPHASAGRVILKVDAEGYDAKVIAGAKGLLDSGRVSLVIWEHIRHSWQGPGRADMLALVESLHRRGFRHLRDDLTPFDPDTIGEWEGNVFACAPGLELSPR
jgi:FkbM family methyltransferase